VVRFANNMLEVISVIAKIPKESVAIYPFTSYYSKLERSSRRYAPQDDSRYYWRDWWL